MITTVSKITATKSVIQKIRYFEMTELFSQPVISNKNCKRKMGTSNRTQLWNAIRLLSTYQTMHLEACECFMTHVIHLIIKLLYILFQCVTITWWCYHPLSSFHPRYNAILHMGSSLNLSLSFYLSFIYFFTIAPADIDPRMYRDLYPFCRKSYRSFHLVIITEWICPDVIDIYWYITETNMCFLTVIFFTMTAPSRLFHRYRWKTIILVLYIQSRTTQG